MTTTRYTRRGFIGSCARLGVLSAGAAILAGCAQPTPTPVVMKETVVVKETAVVKETVITKPTAAPAAKVKLNYMVGFSGNVATPDAVAATKKMFDRFVAASKTVSQIEVISVPNAESVQKLTTMAAGGVPPDLIAQGANWVLGAQGICKDIRPMVEQDKADLSDWEPAGLASFTVDQRNNMLYGLPYCLNLIFLKANKTLCDQKGVKLPTKWSDESWTFDACTEALGKLTSGDGATKTYGTGGFWDSFATQFFGDDVVDDAVQKVLIDQPAAIKGYRYLYDLTYKYHYQPTSAEAKGLGNGFYDGRTGFDFAGPWDIGSLLKVTKFKWDLAPLPFGGTGANPKFRATPFWPDAFSATNGATIPQTWEVIKFMLLDSANYKEWVGIIKTMPTRKSFRDDFVKTNYTSANPDVNWAVTSEGGSFARPYLQAKIYAGDFATIMSAGLDPVRLGKQTPEEAIPPMKPKLQESLDAGNKKLADLINTTKGS